MPLANPPISVRVFRKLNARTPSDWAILLEAVSCGWQERCKVGILVAFDYGHRDTEEWIKHFDRFRDSGHNADANEVERVLVELGYPPRRAKRRAHQIIEYEKYIPGEEDE